MKTYLQLVNEVLKRLREDQVSTVDSSTYSTLIGTFVNDAKREVENAWNWQVLKQPYIVTPDGLTHSFDITGLTDPDARLAYDSCGQAMVYDVKASDEFQLNEVPYDYIVGQYLTDPDSFTSNDKPTFFAVNKDSDGQWKVYFNGICALDRSYWVYFYVPQDELESDSTVIRVPWRPVAHLALLYALDERGEEIGEPGSKAWMRYDNSLSDAISMDSVGNSDKITFKV
jgi:hypothetical protein